MKKLICLTLTFAMLMSLLPGVISVAASNSFGWTASSASGNTAIDSIDTIKGSGVAFRAWGTSAASMLAEKTQSGAYAMCFSVAFPELKAVRTFKVSGIEMLVVDKDGAVKSGGKTLSSSTELNKWNDVEIVVYPEQNRYTVSYNEVTEAFTAVGIEALESVQLLYSDIAAGGATTLVSDPVISAITGLGGVSSPSKTEIPWSGDSLSADTATGTRTYYYNYSDTTGAGRDSVLALEVDGVSGGEFRSANNNNSRPVPENLVEFSFDYYVPEPEQGQTAPAVDQHQLIGNGWNTNPRYYYFVELDHSDKELRYKRASATNYQSVDLDYEYGAWYTCKIYLDYNNDMCYIRVLDSNGKYIGGAQHTEDLDAGAFVNSDTAKIVTYSVQINFRDTDAQYVALLDNYGFSQWGTDNAVLTQTIPYSGKINAAPSSDFVFKYDGAPLDAASLSTAVVTANGDAVAAQLTAVDGGFKAELENDLASGTDYTISVEGIKDIRGNAVSAALDLTTSGGEAVGNLSISESSGSATASVKLGTTTKNLNLYGVVYDSDGSMADYTPTVQAAGTVNDVLEAPVTASYSGGAAAYLWDDQMNIVTPAITTVADTISSADPCAVSITKVYDPVEKFVIKGTAKLGAAMKLYSVSNKDTASEAKELIYIKEVSALANGYFETSFESDVTGDVELVINTQDGSGIQTVEQRIYSPAEAAEIVDAFNYLDDNPTYDGAVEEQYNAMVDYYDNLIKDHYRLFGINLTEYNTLSKNKIAEILLSGSGTYDLDSDVVNKYNMAAATCKFDAASDDSAVEGLIAQYATVYNFAASETYSYFSNLSGTIKQAVHSAMASKNNYADMDDVLDFLEEQVIVTAIKYAENDGDVYNLILKNQTYLELDLSEYNKLYNKSVVASAIKGQEYDTVSEFKADFIAKVQAAKAAEAENSLAWIANSNRGNTAIDLIDSIKGSAVAFRAWGAADASMTAQSPQLGACSVSFSVLFSDLNAVRTLKAAGLDMLTVNKTGIVKSGDAPLATSIELNRWYDVEISVYPSAKTYTVTFGGVSKTFTIAELQAFGSVEFAYSEMDTKGSTTLISNPFISPIADSSVAVVPSKTEISWSGDSLSSNTATGTRTYYYNYQDPTGAGRGSILALEVDGVDGGEFRSDNNDSSRPVPENLVEFSFDYYVPEPEQGKTTPAVDKHQLIGNGWNTTPKYYYFVELDHSDKKLIYNKRNSTSQSVVLDYEYGAWYTCKIYLDYNNDMCYIRILDSNGKYIGGAEYEEDMDAGAFVNSDSAKIVTYSVQINFRDTANEYKAYVDNYGFAQWGASNASFAGTIPCSGKTDADTEGDFIFQYSDSPIDAASLESAVVKVNNSVTSAKLTAVGNGVKVDFNNYLSPAAYYTLSLEGVKDIRGNIISPASMEFTTSGGEVASNLSITETAGSATASVMLGNTTKNLKLYSAVYNSDGSMAAYTPVAQAAGAVNDVLEASVSSSYSGGAAAYLWDEQMNIITPGISTENSSYSFAQPCDVTLLKTYNPDIFTIKGTANRNASIIFKDGLNNVVFVKEVNALPNGYFETSFASPLTGNVTLLINTQNGQGMQTINQYIYTPAEANAAVDAFNYRTANPSYDSTNITQYNAMVDHFDNLIATYEKLFGFNLAEYAAVSKNDVAEILFEGTYNEFNDVVDQYAYAMAVAKFNAAANADGVEALFDQYSEEYDFDLSQTYSYYNTVSDTVKSKIYEKIANKNDYSSMTEVVDYFEEQTILAAVECATINVEIESIINANNTYLQLDMTKFNSLSNPSAVTSVIRGTAYPTVAAFKSDFISKTDTAKINENNLQGGTQQPQGGGGGAAYTPPKENISLPVTEDIAGAVITPDVTFEDIRLVPWAEESILYLAEKGIINGKSKTHFAPSDNIKRSEFVKIITLAFPQSDYDMKNIPFDDVESGAWYEAYVKEAYSRGIINGKSEKSFGVNDNITREEIVVMLYRVAKMRKINLNPTKSVVFDDEATIADYAKEAVRVLSEAEIVSGADNMFMSKNPATRAEAAKLIYCLMQREVE